MGSFFPSETSAAKGSLWYCGFRIVDCGLRIAVAVVEGVVGQAEFGAQVGAFGLPALDDLGQEGVGAGGVVGRVGEGQDVLVRADGEAFDGAEFGVHQLFAQAGQVGGTLGVAGGLVGAGLVADELRLVGHGYPFDSSLDTQTFFTRSRPI